MIKKTLYYLVTFSVCFILFVACSKSGEEQSSPETGTSFFNIDFTDVSLHYANKFKIKISDDYGLITINDMDNYLVVDENTLIPYDLPDDIIVIKKHLYNIYNASSSAMDFFLALEAMDSVTMTGTDKRDWTIPEIEERFDSERLVFVGKYSAPDYEYLADSRCDLAIENTMITHSPKTKELIESLGIPVLVEYSSYENHPLGRMEWIKVYGLLTGNFDRACEIFDNEVAFIDKISEIPKEKKKVAFFYFASNGYALVRMNGDYITRMIEIAGGEYAFSGVTGEDESGKVNTRMEMESFFLEGYDSDIIIYNSTVDGGLKSIEELMAKSDVIKSFKAVENGEVYGTNPDFFQKTMSLGKMIEDFSKVMANPDVADEELSFLYRIK